MTMLVRRLGAAGAVLSLCLLGTASWAGGSARPGPLRLAQDDPQAPDGSDPADSSALVVRIGRLENQLRSLTGQIEQLQFDNKRLENDLRKMQGDVDFRFQDLQRPGVPTVRPMAPQKRTDTDPAVGADTATGAPPDDLPAGLLRQKPARAVGDAFDPDANPTAPGAPRPLGTTTASQPLAARPSRLAAGPDPHAPLDLMQHTVPAEPDTDPDLAQPSVIPAPAVVPRDPNAVASLAPGGTREEYDSDMSLFKQGQFDSAATGFQAFATKYPRDRLTSDAVFLAGESYARLGRHREAAEQFLRVSTDFGKSSRAPEALLRLGMSLNALGAKDQACATYVEVNRRYPAASAEVRTGVDRELKRARCPGNG